jgi:hypothetical protein
MCLPGIDPVSVALLTIGTGLQVYGQQQAEKATKRAQVAELARQDKFRKDATQRFNQATQDVTQPEQQRRFEQERLMRQGVFRKAAKSNDTSYSPGEGSSSIVNADAAATRSTVSREGQSAADALAALTAWGPSDFGTRATLSQSGADIYGLGDAARASFGILPLELEAAQRKGASTRMLGDLFSVGGSIYNPNWLAASPARAAITKTKVFG